MADTRKRRPKPLTAQEVAAKYGASWAIINQDAALLAWFNDFAKRYTESNGQISQDTFILELNQQKWWSDNSGTYISDLQQELDNPKDWNQAVTRDAEDIRNLAASLGANVSDDVLRTIAIAARRSGWGQAQIENELAKYTGGSQTGAAGTFAEDFAAWSYRNGIRIAPTQVQRWQQQIAAGDLTDDDVRRQIRQTYMVGAFPAWAEQINAGMDVADIAEPYRQTMADLLEMDPDQLDMRDPLMQKALQAVDSQGKPTVTPLYKFTDMVRRDDRWQYTDNAYAQYANTARNVLSTFGFGG